MTTKEGNDDVRPSPQKRAMVVLKALKRARMVPNMKYTQAMPQSVNAL
jgi:hypothetical protein